MKKILCVLLALLLPVGSLAAARMPIQRGTINDAADVLTAQTVADLSEFSKQFSKEADINLHVVTVHFLDGLDVQTYADLLAKEWEMEDDDMLLVCAAGEDSFATAMGQKAEETVGRANADNLLYTSSEFGALFRSQQYDAAFAAYAKGLSNLIEKQTGESIRMTGLFGEQAMTIPQQIDLYGGQVWQDVMDSIQAASVDVQQHFVEEEDRENGLTAGGWIVLIILISIVLRQNKRDRRGRSGCGCSPLGWIFGLFGLHWLFDRD